LFGAYRLLSIGLQTRVRRTDINAIVDFMAQLLVRNIEDQVVQELKVRAARHGRSAEEEHRQILRDALEQAGPPLSLKDLLLDIPDVGEDRDFERPRDRGRSIEL
jgi:plasmid stability protein